MSTREALAVAARFLRTGVRSVHEVRAYLTRREISPAAVRRVIDQLLAQGTLDDCACARLWAEHWARRGYAWSAIRLKLTAKGLSDEVIARAVNTLGTAAADVTRARELVERHCRRTTQRRASPRLWRLLASRGFDQDVIEQVLTVDVE